MRHFVLVVPVLLVLGCQPRAATPTRTAPQSTDMAPPTVADTTPPQSEALPCPPPDPEHHGFAPWDIWRFDADCIRGPEGRWTVEADTSDADGWRHVLVFEGVDGRSWRLEVIAPVGLARRLDGAVVVLDLREGAQLVAPDGSVVWRSTFPNCGAVRNEAIGWDDAITFTCGYSLLRLNADGSLAWQRWPFGNTSIGGPWVDRDGTLYVSGGGHVAAVAPDGSARWDVATGWNRYVGAIAWLQNGNMVFATTQDEMHTPTSDDGVRIYYEAEAAELFEVTRTGTVVRRESFWDAAPQGGWPAVVPEPEDRSYRAPPQQR